MAEKKPKPLNGTDKLTLLIDDLKKDNLMQFGEIKKEFGGMSKQLDSHDRRITNLERDKIERDAVENYKRNNPNSASGRQSEYNDKDGSITLNKELLTALKYLGLVVAALAAAILAMKVKP